MHKGLKKGKNIKQIEVEESSPYKTKKSEIQEQIDHVYVDDNDSDDIIEVEENVEPEEKIDSENPIEKDNEAEEVKDIKESKELDEPKDQLNTDIKHVKKQNKFIQFLNKKKVAIPLIVILSLGLLLVIGLTDIKYSVLGVVVKKDIIIETIDNKTLQPVSGVSVAIDDIKSKSNSSGIATLKKVSTGKHLVKLTKSGYTSKNQEIIVRFSTTKIKPIRITGTGYLLSFIVKDKISETAIKGIKVSLGGTDALTNDNGEATIRALPSGTAKLTLTVSGTDYKTNIEEITVTEGAPVKEVSLSPSGTILYISNKSKTYDVYASDLDGTNERVILAGTGNENDSINIIPSSNGKYAALLSTRDFVGEVYLYVFNIESGQYKKVSEKVSSSSAFWSDNKLIYSYYEYPANGMYRQIYNSYDAETEENSDISLPNGYYYYLKLAEGRLYYTLNDAKMPEYGVFSMNASGGDKRKIAIKPSGYIKRHSVSQLGLPSYLDNSYRTYNLLTGAIEDSTNNNATIINTVLSTKDNKRIFNSYIDDSFELFISNADGSNEKQLTNGASVSDYFYITPNNKYLIFYGRIGTDSGVYIMPIDGGNPQLITSAHVITLIMGFQ